MCYKCCLLSIVYRNIRKFVMVKNKHNIIAMYTILLLDICHKENHKYLFVNFIDLSLLNPE